MLSTLHNYLKTVLLNLTAQSNSQEGRAKVSDGIISVFTLLGTMHRYLKII